MNSSGTLVCGAAQMGDAKNFTVDHTGVARYPIGPPTYTNTPAYPDVGASSFSTDTGLGITTTTTPTEALNKIDSWIETYMLDAPPALTSGSSSQQVEMISVSWSNPVQKKLAFSTGYIPQISATMVDIVPTLQNTNNDWSSGSAWTLTLETMSTTKPLVTSLNLILDYNSGTSGVVSNTIYKYYGTTTATRITQGTKYDIRVYAMNQATQSGAKSPRYLVFSNVGTLTAGPPGAPTGVAVGSITTTGSLVSWSMSGVPRDSTSSATPTLTQYKVNITPVSSSRYGGISSSGLVTPQSTAATTASDATPSLTLSSLNPGSVYDVTVAAKNALNVTFGSSSSPAVRFTTTAPSAPPNVSTSTLTVSNESSLTYGSGLSGTRPDGTTAASPIYNYNLMTTSPPVSNTVTARLNNAVSTTAASVGSIVAYAGTVGSESSVSLTTVGFGNTFTSSQNRDNVAVRLAISSEGDYYTGVSSGFYKVATASVQALNVSSNYTASFTSYDMWMVFSQTGGSSSTTSKASFYVDALNTLPSVTGGGIMGGTGVSYITGVPSFVGTSVFAFRATVSGLLYQFLRSNGQHLDATLQTSSGTVVSSTLTIAKSSINGSSHSYYAPPSQSYGLSTTKHNTSGSVLTINPGSIQFADFTLTLSASSSTCTENLSLYMVPYNLQGVGASTSISGFVSTSSGASSAIRVDLASLTALSGMTGTLLSCGSGQFPAVSSLTALDHTASIAGTSQLQMINGAWQTPSAGTGYKNYSGYYFPSPAAGPDYTGISATGYRYVCISFANLSSSTYDSVKIQFDSSGLSMTPSTDSANFQLYIKVVPPSGSATVWVSCTASINPTGYSAISSDGQGAMNNASSTVSGAIYVYVPPATAGASTVYLRFGLNMALNQSVSNIRCTHN